MKKKIITVSAIAVSAAIAALTFTGCGQQSTTSSAAPSSSEAVSSISSATTSMNESNSRVVQLDSTSLVASIPSNFKDATIMKDKYPNETARYVSDSNGTVISVHEFDSSNLPEGFKGANVTDAKSFAETYAQFNKGGEVKTGKTNDLDYASCDVTNKDDKGKEYKSTLYFVKTGNEYIMLAVDYTDDKGKAMAEELIKSVKEVTTAPVQLGTSGLTVVIPSTFKLIETPADYAQGGEVARYETDSGSTMHVFQRSKDELDTNTNGAYKDAKDLKSFTELDAKIYGGGEVKTGKINDLDYAMFTGTYNGMEYAEYIFENNNSYLSIYMYFNNDDEKAVFDKIINSIAVLKESTIQLGTSDLSMKIPDTFTAVQSPDDHVKLGEIARYTNSELGTVVVYQFDKDNLGDAYKDTTDLKSFAEADAALYNGKVEALKINGLECYSNESAWNEPALGDKLNSTAYLFDGGKCYISIGIIYKDVAQKPTLEAIVNTVTQNK